MVRDLVINAVPVVFKKQEIGATPRAWAEATGRLILNGNGTAVIE